MGMIFDIKRYAIHDGPGIRTTVFFKGCPLTCSWCHNPEGKSPEPEFMWWEKKCLNCRDCQKKCPNNAISFSDTFIIEKEKCNLCKTCLDACHTGALELIGKEMTVSDVVKEIEKDIPFYDESQGGVTISGGEPLMQPDFLCNLLKACKTRGITTALDTCGYAPLDVLLTISEYVDLFLYDVKTMDDTVHKKVTGVSNTRILTNLKALVHKNVIVRFPLIPGVNNDEKDVESLGKFVYSLGLHTIAVLPYHAAGIEKVKRLQSNTVYMTNPPTAETIQKTKTILQETGLNVQVGG
jgi:pyruvate formate lyase activating enzyme